MPIQDTEMEDRFAAIDGVSSQGQRLPYLLEGQYILEVDAIKAVSSRTRRFYYVAEFTIFESNNEQRPVGLQVSWMTDMDKDMGPINVKRFLGAVFGYAHTKEIDANVTSEMAKLSALDEQPCKGCRVHCQVTMILTKEKKEFSEHRFTPVNGYSFNELNPG